MVPSLQSGTLEDIVNMDVKVNVKIRQTGSWSKRKKKLTYVKVYIKSKTKYRVFKVDI
jgi:hypothetical protein